MKTITVLMSTYNGEKYLPEQIKSLIAQEDVSLSILVRDDGSTDDTKDLLEEYQKNGVLTWYKGANLRPARSFLDLIDRAPESDYYAFCDQDDVWNKDKLKIAIGQLETIKEKKRPSLYCSNYQLVDENLCNLPDNGHVSTTTLGAALVTSNCTGCTTVFNRSLLEFLRMGKPDVIVMHDDWAHKVCLAVGGKVIYDETRTLKYRQHGNNADGGVHDLKHKVIGIAKRIAKKDRVRSIQLKCLNSIYAPYMSQYNRQLMNKMIAYCDGRFFQRLKILQDADIYTSYSRFNKSFRIAVIFKYY